MQEDNTNSTSVASEQSEEPERSAVGGSDARNNAKAPYVDGRLGVEDSMDCGEEILGDTNATVERQAPTSATTRRREYHNREAVGKGTGKREARNKKLGEVEDHTQPVEEVRTAAQSISSKITKKE
jgi:hypothetical protein